MLVCCVSYIAVLLQVRGGASTWAPCGAHLVLPVISCMLERNPCLPHRHTHPMRLCVWGGAGGVEGVGAA